MEVRLERYLFFVRFVCGSLRMTCLGQMGDQFGLNTGSTENSICSTLSRNSWGYSLKACGGRVAYPVAYPQGPFGSQEWNCWCILASSLRTMHTKGHAQRIHYLTMYIQTYSDCRNSLRVIALIPILLLMYDAVLSLFLNRCWLEGSGTRQQEAWDCEHPQSKWTKICIWQQVRNKHNVKWIYDVESRSDIGDVLCCKGSHTMA